MDELLRQIQQVQRKARQMGQQLEKMQARQAALQQQLMEAREALSEKEKAFALLTEQYEALKLIKSMDNGTDREAVREKIDLYLKEIDTCLKSFGE
jgi:chromosome segregation ATPase